MNEREKQAQVLRDASITMRKLASERDDALTAKEAAEKKLASLRTRLEAEKLAADMHEKGLRKDVEFSALVDDIEKAAHEGRLSVVQEAVKLAAPDMGGNFRINHDEKREGAPNDLEQYLVGNVG